MSTAVQTNSYLRKSTPEMPDDLHLGAERETTRQWKTTLPGFAGDRTVMPEVDPKLELFHAWLNGDEEAGERLWMSGAGLFEEFVRKGKSRGMYCLNNLFKKGAVTGSEYVDYKRYRMECLVADRLVVIMERFKKDAVGPRRLEFKTLDDLRAYVWVSMEKDLNRLVLEDLGIPVGDRKRGRETVPALEAPEEGGRPAGVVVEDTRPNPEATLRIQSRVKLAVDLCREFEKHLAKRRTQETLFRRLKNYFGASGGGVGGRWALELLVYLEKGSRRKPEEGTGAKDPEIRRFIVGQLNVKESTFDSDTRRLRFTWKQFKEDGRRPSWRRFLEA